MGSNRSSDKDRLKWTKELHDLFEKVVIQIGGPERATPKGILRAMGIPGLTIFHVKSHLQKYRMSIFTREEDYTKDKFGRRSMSKMLPNFSTTSGAQLNEALYIQMETQRRLSDQVEVQKSLKMKIEVQARFLYKIMEELKNREATNDRKLMKPYSPNLSLPSLIEESDQSDIKQFGTDSEEVDSNTTEIRFNSELRAQKRIKIKDNFIPEMQKLPEQNLDLFSFDHGMKNNNLFQEHEIGFPWSFQTPLLPTIYNPLNNQNNRVPRF